MPPLLRKPMLFRSSKLAKNKRRVLYLKITAILFIVGSLVGASSYLSIRPEGTINSIAVHGNEVLSEDELRTLTQEWLVGKYFFLFSRSNIFIFPRLGIETAIRDMHKRVREVDVSREGLTEISVRVIERKPFALWCKEIELISASEEEATSTTAVVVQEEKSEKCYFLDGDGFVFSESPTFTGNVYFKYKGEVLEDEPVGTQFLTHDQFGELRLFLDAIRDLEITPVSLEVNDKEEFRITLQKGGEIIFGSDQSLSSTLDNLESALEAEVFKQRDISTLEYIDLRFGNKVYYRFK